MPFLQFKGKTSVETYHHTLPHHAFEFDDGRSLLDANQSHSLNDNLIIEGDNLLALKALLPTHAGKVKCIYIDPPYNTGNEGWVYNDNLTQPLFKEWHGKTVDQHEVDVAAHDKWCCMMYPRLSLLKELLHEDGAIFISIDDNEYANLRLLMDEIFGGENFVTSIVWHKVDSPKNTAVQFSEDHEYIVVYAKKPNWKPRRPPRTEAMVARYKNIDNDPRGPWMLGDLAARNYYSQGMYPITTPKGRVIEGPPSGSYWRVSKDKFDELVKDNRIWWGKSGDNRPGIKRFLSEAQDGIVPQTLWSWKDVGSTRNSKQELSKIMAGDERQESLFVTPKPTGLLKRILQLATDPDSIVLDSFAGSGTTAHAVLSANQDDGGKRRFILVQQKHDNKDNERDGINICESVTAARVRRVVQGVNTEPLTGTFSYVCLSQLPMLGDYRDLGSKLPNYEEIAQYIFFTETSYSWSAEHSHRSSGRLGQHAGTAYYLLYTPNGEEDGKLDREFLTDVAAQEECIKLVVYCEKVWMHRDELREWQAQHGKTVRHMLVPFNLK